MHQVGIPASLLYLVNKLATGTNYSRFVAEVNLSSNILFLQHHKFPPLPHARTFPRTAEIKPAKVGSRWRHTLLARMEISANTAFAAFAQPVGKTVRKCELIFLPE